MIWFTTVLGFTKRFSLGIFSTIKRFLKWDSEQGKWLSPLKTFIILGFVGYILYVHSCTQINCPNITEEVDTLVITKIDTVWFEKPQTTIGKKPIRKPGGTLVNPNPKTPCDSLFQYTQEYEDSLIKGVLTADVKGVLLGSKFDYTPKFPKYINRVDSVFITKTIIQEIPRQQRPYGLIIGGGLNVGHDQSIGVTLDAGVQMKQGFDIIYRFDALRLTHSIGITHTFEFNKKKNK